MAMESWSDKDLLVALTLAGQGWTRKAIGDHLGRSKNSVIGTLNRIQNEMAYGSAGDGTMPDDWWIEGLEKRGAAQ
tara:strand:+ start:1265 stop:1492 length:228 start_codon:yes stop_codon:yes gene_type:complete